MSPSSQPVSVCGSPPFQRVQCSAPVKRSVLPGGPRTLVRGPRPHSSAPARPAQRPAPSLGLTQPPTERRTLAFCIQGTAGSGGPRPCLSRGCHEPREPSGLALVRSEAGMVPEGLGHKGKRINTTEGRVSVTPMH